MQFPPNPLTLGLLLQRSMTRAVFHAKRIAPLFPTCTPIGRFSYYRSNSQSVERKVETYFVSGTIRPAMLAGQGCALLAESLTRGASLLVASCNQDQSVKRLGNLIDEALSFVAVLSS